MYLKFEIERKVVIVGTKVRPDRLGWYMITKLCRPIFLFLDRSWLADRGMVVSLMTAGISKKINHFP